MHLNAIRPCTITEAYNERDIIHEDNFQIHEWPLKTTFREKEQEWKRWGEITVIKTELTAGLIWDASLTRIKDFGSLINSPITGGKEDNAHMQTYKNRMHSNWTFTPI